MQPLTLLRRLGFSMLGLLIPTVSATAATGCTHTWSLGRLAKEADRLDGQISCVRALLRPLPFHDRSSALLYVYEAVPLDPKQRQIEANRVGLLDWDKELGIDKSL